MISLDSKYAVVENAAPPATSSPDLGRNRARYCFRVDRENEAVQIDSNARAFDDYLGAWLVSIDSQGLRPPAPQALLIPSYGLMR
jgi:hypothetical protein